jgi:hypothetical protein
VLTSAGIMYLGAEPGSMNMDPEPDSTNMDPEPDSMNMDPDTDSMLRIHNILVWTRMRIRGSFYFHH